MYCMIPLYEVSVVVKFIESKSEMVVSRAGGGAGVVVEKRGVAKSTGFKL